MRISLTFVTLATVFLASIDATLRLPGDSLERSLGQPSSCKKQCKKPTHCKSDVVINEVEVSKDVNIPSVEAREHVIYKKVPVPEYEIKEKVTTKLIQVPSRQFNFRKNYIDTSRKMKVKKPLIKYNVTTVDIEVERLVVHEKPVLKDVTVERIKYVPDITDHYEPITVQKRRPVGKPQPEAKHVTIPKGVNRVPKKVIKEVRVPEITYHYCDHEKNIYVPDKCNPPGSSSGDGTGTRTSTSFDGSSDGSSFESSADGDASGNSFSSSSSFRRQAVRSFPDLEPPTHDQGFRFARNPAPEAPAAANIAEPEELKAPLPQEVKPEDDGLNFFSAGRFGRAIGSFL